MRRQALVAACILLTPLLAHAELVLQPGTAVPLTTSGTATDPAISGNLVVYTDLSASGDSDIFATDITDLNNLSRSTIYAGPNDQHLSDVSNGLVVYTDTGSGQVFAVDTATNTRTQVSLGSRSTAANAAVSNGAAGSRVVWTDNRSGGFDIYGRDLSSSTESVVSATGGTDDLPAIDGANVAWERCSSTGCDIYLKAWNDAGGGAAVTTSHKAHNPDVRGHWLVYVEGDPGAGVVSALDLNNLSAGPVSTAAVLPQGDQRNPNVSGDYVAFEHQLTASAPHDIYIWHIPSGKIIALTNAVDDHFLNDIDGQKVVYTRFSDTTFTSDIELTQFSAFELPDPTPTAVTCANPGSSILLHVAQYERGTGKPVAAVVDLQSTPAGRALVCIENGTGGHDAVTAAVVTLNGETVATPDQFKKAGGSFSGEADLGAQNRLGVRVAGKPGSAITVKVYAVQGQVDRTVTIGSTGSAATLGGEQAEIDEARVAERGGSAAGGASAAGGVALSDGPGAAGGSGELSEAEPMPGYGCSTGGSELFVMLGLVLAGLLAATPKRHPVKVQQHSRPKK